MHRELVQKIQQLKPSRETRYISFGMCGVTVERVMHGDNFFWWAGLYGTDPKYNLGAIRNAELAQVLFCGLWYLLDVEMMVERRTSLVGSCAIMWEVTYPKPPLTN